MSLQSLPSPYEITGGDNPFYQASGNIAGFADGASLPVRSGDYDRYLQASSPFAALEDDTDRAPSWVVGLLAGAYGLSRTDKNPFAGLIGLFAGIYLPRFTTVIVAGDALLSNDGAARLRDTYDRYRPRR